MTVVPHLWFDKDGGSAVETYVRAFPDSAVLHESVLTDTPSGTVGVYQLRLAGRELHLLAAGPEFRLNPSLSFLYTTTVPGEVDRVHALLVEGGHELMPLGTYPFSSRYAWVQDRWGVSWQLMTGEAPDRLIPAQMFVGPNAGRAAEALAFYTGLLGGRVLLESHYSEAEAPNLPTMINHAQFTLAGSTFALMDSAFPHEFAFNEAHSYLVTCDTQAEIDRLWAALSSDPSAEACGWCKDRYGFSWQIVPRQLGVWMSDPQTAGPVSRAFLAMKKLDIAALERAASSL